MLGSFGLISAGPQVLFQEKIAGASYSWDHSSHSGDLIGRTARRVLSVLLPSLFAVLGGLNDRTIDQPERDAA